MNTKIKSQIIEYKKNRLKEIVEVQKVEIKRR